ncbi:hypothetical protein FACS189491_09640 [Spirochaetia bacterium]|nr:hypothetical protein FACS189491_09640 [Spirochaetia bacterium]
MKIAIATTTIHISNVIALHQEYYPDAVIHIAGDRKTPHGQMRAFIKTLPNVRYYSPEDQQVYACSEPIGWNKIMRRNLAILEAIKDGADVIVSIDDDNIPMTRNHIPAMGKLLELPFSGCILSSENHWLNPGIFLVPPVIIRGFDFDKKGGALIYETVVRKKVGVAAGLSLGDPDITAAEWLVNPPKVTGYHELLESGFVVSPDTWSPFNSQNTAWRRELAPLMFVIPFVGRYDDIWCCYIAERIMRETDFHIYFGKPFSLQSRVAHNYISELALEMPGIKYTDQLCKFLDSLTLPHGDVNEKLKAIFTELKETDFFPQEASDAGIAWCEDITKVWK